MNLNLFQWITLPPLLVLFAWESARALLRRPRLRADRVVRAGVWLAAAVAIYDPGLTSQAALTLGITRGTDLVLYAFALAFLAVSFYFYSRAVRMERQMTELVRQMAIAGARRENSVGGGE